jgi:DDE superfamily endonuclease
MEDLLWLYGLPLDPLHPVVCFDERPCFLIGDVAQPLALKAGEPLKERYEYQKNGSCSLLAALEPLTGKRVAQVYGQRTKREYALCCRELSQAYPEAKKIRLVQDNLNTHGTSAFYETFGPEEAFALAQRFEFHYTPKKGSWLNLIEIEFSALARNCLNRRIASQGELEREALAFLILLCYDYSCAIAPARIISSPEVLSGKNASTKFQPQKIERREEHRAH